MEWVDCSTTDIKSEAELDMYECSSRSFNHGYTMKEFFLKVKYVDESSTITKYIQVNGSANDFISYDDIVTSICSGTNYCEENIAHFTDKDGCIISKPILENIVSQFIKCSCFELNVHIRSIPMEPIPITTNRLSEIPVSIETIIPSKETLRNFIEKSDGGIVLLEEYEQNQTFKDSTRRLLINICGRMLENCYGAHPTRQEKILFAHAIIDLFPTYRVNNSEIDGIDLFYDYRRNSGWLEHKIKNQNVKNSKMKRNYDSTSTKGSTNKRTKLSVNAKTDTNSIENENLKYLSEICFLDDSDTQTLNQIKQKLIATFEKRRSLIGSSKNLFKDFPYLFASTKIINFEFEIKYKNESKNLINSWQKYLNVLDDVLHSSIGDVQTKDISPEINGIIKLSTLLPTQPKKGTKKTTNDPTELFIQFEEKSTSPDDFVIKQSEPIIICQSLNNDKNNKLYRYYLSINSQLINVPKYFRFIDVFDIYFKCFYVFSIEYPTEITTFLRFLEIFLYKINENKESINNRMIEIDLKFNHRMNQN